MIAFDGTPRAASPEVVALLGERPVRPGFRIERTEDVAAYRELRRRVFVVEQGLFSGTDLDEHDEDPRTVVLVARDESGRVVGGVRLHPARVEGPDIGWWQGGRLVVDPAVRGRRGGADSAGRGTGGGWSAASLFQPTFESGDNTVSLRSAGQVHPIGFGVAGRAGESGSGGGGGGGIGGGGVGGGGESGVGGVGPALVRAACAYAEATGALRFDATVQADNEPLFTRLGWVRVRDVGVAGRPHVLMRWPIGRIAKLVAATKRDLGRLLEGLRPGGAGFVGDDGAPVPGSDLVAACDAIVPSMVERSPEWAGWCSVLVNLNDLAAMGAEPVGLLDALGARDVSFASRVLSGLRAACAAYDVPVLGGHTQLGVPAALSVTALGRTAHPVPAGGGEAGQHVRLTADLGGGWRAGYQGRQWDSTSHRRTPELRAMLGSVAAARPKAAKDVSMAGVVGTLGMLAEASGCAAVLDVAAVPRPRDATVGDWLTCFPGFAMLTTDDPGTPPPPAGPAESAVCGELTTGHGVVLRWPDGDLTDAVTDAVTGMGTA